MFTVWGWKVTSNEFTNFVRRSVCLSYHGVASAKILRISSRSTKPYANPVDVTCLF